MSEVSSTTKQEGRVYRVLSHPTFKCMLPYCQNITSSLFWATTASRGMSALRIIVTSGEGALRTLAEHDVIQLSSEFLNKQSDCQCYSVALIVCCV